MDAATQSVNTAISSTGRLYARLAAQQQTAKHSLLRIHTHTHTHIKCFVINRTSQGSIHRQAVKNLNSTQSIFMKDVQCESKKIPPPQFSDIFSQTDGNFLINFYTPITRSFLHQTTNFYSIISNFDEFLHFTRSLTSKFAY